MKIGGRWLAALGILVAAGVLVVFLPDFLDPYRLPRGDWRVFQKNFVASDGRVIDTGNGNISHSEGQGYAMLFALAYRDRAAFERIWTWTRNNLQTRPDDKLISWLWKPDGQGGGTVSDPNNASDGDILVAWALLRANQLWQDFSHQQAALQILADLARLDVIEQNDRTLLLPGTDGFVKEDAVTLNPSYSIFPALAEFANQAPTGPWKKLEQSGSALVEQARFGEWQLTSDWLRDTDGTLSVSPDFPPVFGYNAVRVPLHIGWLNPRSALMQPFAEFWKNHGGDAQPATVNLETGAFGPDPALPGMRAVAAFTVACAENRRLTVRDLPALKWDEPYFSASLNLLTKIAVREAFAPK